jgi:hypothetical protein
MIALNALYGISEDSSLVDSWELCLPGGSQEDAAKDNNHDNGQNQRIKGQL